MKQKVYLAVVLSVSLLALSGIGYTAYASYEMWSQPPDWPLGFDIPSFTPFDDQSPGLGVADDFLTDNTRNPITDLHWWGSYETEPPAVAAPITSFWVGFWTDVPAGSGQFPYSYPGALVKKYEFENVVGNFDGVQQWARHSGYYYSVDFSSDPLLLNPNTVHWVSILAMSDPQHPPQGWGWKTSDRHWNDDAIEVFIAPGTGEPNPGDPLFPNVGFPIELIYPEGHPNAGKSVDMAFKVTATPEPISCALFLFGGGVLFAGSRLRRKIS